MSWPTVPAAELMLKRGGSVNPANYPDETFELLSIPAFDKGEPEIVEGKEIGSSKSCVQPNDVLLSKIVPHIKRCWVVPAPQSTYRQIGSGEWIIFRSDKIHPPFLRHFLTSEIFHKQFMNTTAGVGGSLVRARPAEVGNIEIPLPPLPEQKRIAAILDKADAIRRKRQQAIQLADDFLRAVFLDMFGDVIEGAENVVRFSDVAVLDAPMVDPRVDEYIDLIHIGPDRIEKKNGKLLPALTAREEGLISKKFLFDDRYVLYSKIRPYLRKCAMAEEVGLCSADMYPVRPVEGVATKEFLWMLLLSDFFTAYTESLPARANIPKLNREELEAFTFSLPEYSQQLKFSSIVRATNIACQRVVESAADVDGAFESLSQKAFSGQL
ncbi:restriction endonuclease subunit S [Stutzerimonas stutzeri]|uniref:restriction endonuclease subunit S n=3 Tax=Stutzerimonas stutzeri TaxID=316 RepID=UPI000A5C82A2|nr:restriction endonuclease subunit S [Stutzerimonas stutzeri]MDH0184100.1 restriction endonuclease subunit S [Stutzerimonas stutzeri]MDH1248561.1 restriction endonuclease subunit S [Stutzerimonas stutzeri]